MKKCARAIILIDNEYIFIERKKKDKETYYATVGGHLDEGETFEEALYREVYEELGVKCISHKLLFELESIEISKIERFYSVKLESNKFSHGNGPEFTDVDFNKYGSYEIVRINKNNIDNYNIVPLKVKEYLKESL